MSATVTPTDDEQTDVELQYGDQFRHVITGDVRTVQDVRDSSEKVCWVEGGWDYKDELLAAVNDETSLYEVEARGDEYENTPY